MEDITDTDYIDEKRACNDFDFEKKKKNSSECYDLCLQIDTSFLADVFNNFWNMCLEIYGLTPALPVPGLTWWAALKKTKVKLDLLTEIGILLMAEKGK